MPKYAAGELVYIELPHHKDKPRRFMHVLGYNTHSEVMCYWHSEEGTFLKGDFPESFLNRLPVPDSDGKEMPPFEDLIIVS